MILRFLNDGDITTRGEMVSSYKKGDEVQVLKVQDKLYWVVIKTGESKGAVAFIDKNYLGE